ncbi:MAG: hypothetical protein E7331_04085 [Clostridiales bacterium]|nr:hypothetical protein [Clostridiales bacterium]
MRYYRLSFLAEKTVREGIIVFVWMTVWPCIAMAPQRTFSNWTAFFQNTARFEPGDRVQERPGKAQKGELFRKCFGDGRRNIGLKKGVDDLLLINCGEIVGELWKTKAGFQ